MGCLCNKLFTIISTCWLVCNVVLRLHFVTRNLGTELLRASKESFTGIISTVFGFWLYLLWTFASISEPLDIYVYEWISCMAAAGYQDPTEDLNVQGVPIARQFENFEESKIDKEIEEQPLKFPGYLST